MDSFLLAVLIWVAVGLLVVATCVGGVVLAMYRQRLATMPGIRSIGVIALCFSLGMAGVMWLIATGIMGVSDPRPTPTLAWLSISAIALLLATLWIVAVIVDARMARQRPLLDDDMPADPRRYGGATKSAHQVDSDGDIMLSAVSYQPGRRNPKVALR